jgi:hypothetical protein
MDNNVQKEFFSAVRVESTSGQNPLQLAFENLVDNTKTMYLERVAVGISFQNPTMARDYEETLTVDISRINSVTPGLILPVANLNFGSQASTSLRVSLPSNVSGLAARSFTKHPTGECNLEFQGRIIVPPGNNLLVSIIDNRAPGRIGTLAATVIWSEV